MTGLTDTAFAWTVAGIGSVIVLLILWVANRRHTDEPPWAPWDERLIARGICPIHAPAALGSEDCDSDCPPPREVVDAEMDALDDHIHHGTPLPEPACTHIKVSSTPVWDWLRDTSGITDQAVARKIRVDGLAVGVDLGLPAHTVRFVYADGTVVDRDVTAAVEAWQLRQTEIAELGPVEPVVRYWVTRPSIGWHGREVTQREYVRLEHEFRFRTEVGPEPVTRWFCERFGVSAWTTRGGNRGDAPTSFSHHRDSRPAGTGPVDTIALAKADEMAARMRQPEIRRPIPVWPPLGGDPNRELTDLPQWADTEDHGPRTVSPWDQPAKRINGSAL